jgi:hypothetical protein
MSKKTTPEQHFAKIFNLYSNGATKKERAAAERKMEAWLKRNGKTRADIRPMLAKADADDAAAQPPSDPRDGAPHLYDNPLFNPLNLVQGIVKKYVTMDPSALVIYALWLIATFVYQQFRIVPRVAFISADPDSGKSTALNVGRCLMYRPNPETLGTAAAITEFLDERGEGPGTVTLDELDQIDAGARRNLQKIWNMGRTRGTTLSLMHGGKKRMTNVHAPMAAAFVGRAGGDGGFLAPTQLSRTMVFEMVPYTAATKPERRFDDADTEDLNQIYKYLHSWTARAKLDPDPPMPPEMIRRAADNARVLFSIADACGSEWGQYAREAMLDLLARERVERPELVMVRHGLETFGMRHEADPIRSSEFNKELLRLDLPDAHWDRYCGPSGVARARPITLNEQARLLAKVGIKSATYWPPGARLRQTKSFKGYRREQFEEAFREHCATAADAGPGSGAAPRRLRLIAPDDQG